MRRVVFLTIPFSLTLVAGAIRYHYQYLLYELHPVKFY